MKIKTVITVIGKDKSGIIASVSGLLAENNVNIEDISQTILQGNFTMIMLCDNSACLISLPELIEKCNALGKKIGVSIHVQHEEIFNSMHKI